MSDIFGDQLFLSPFDTKLSDLSSHLYQKASRFRLLESPRTPIFSVQLLRDILGDQLFLPPADTNAPLLSPADLVRRFIISDKPISETEEGVKGAKKAASDAAPDADGFLREGELDEADGKHGFWPGMTVSFRVVTALESYRCCALLTGSNKFCRSPREV